MTKTHRTSLLLETRQPEPAKKSDWRNPYEEGKNLPSSIEEDVRAESLCPEYNEEQMTRISRLKYQSKFGARNPKPASYFKNKTNRKWKQRSNGKHQMMNSINRPNKYHRMEVAE